MPFVALDPDRAEELIRLQIIAVTRLTRAALPGLIGAAAGRSLTFRRCWLSVRHRLRRRCPIARPTPQPGLCQQFHSDSTSELASGIELTAILQPDQ